MPNLAGLTLPTPNVSTGWGQTLNDDFTIIDNVFADAGSGTSVGLQVGSGKTLNAGGTIIAGGTMILGSGDGTNTVTAPTIRGAARTGTNALGGNLTIDAINGTGTGGSGKIIFRTAPASGTPGTTANTMASVLEVNSAGAIGIAGANYGSANQVLLSGGSATTPSWSNVNGSVITIPSQAQGDVLYRGASAWDRLAAGTSGQVLKTNGASANPSWGDIITRSTSQTIASGGNSFTGIPAGVKQITLIFSGLNATTNVTARVRIGTSSGFVSTGYTSAGSWFRADTGSSDQGDSVYATNGMVVFLPSLSWTIYGVVRLTNLTGNQWVSDQSWGGSNGTTPASGMGGGTITLSGVLDRVQIVPNSGSFSASGTVNIIYS